MNYFKNSVEQALATFHAIAALEPEVQKASQLINSCLTSGHKLLICGNGGSASDASHFASEIACRFMGDRRPYPAISLTADGGLLTAIGNDYAFEELFARQVWAYGTPDDVLIVLTTSGKSKNILRALEEGNRRGLKSIALLGRDGGFTKGVATVDITVPGTVTARIQEAHKLLIHVLCEMAEPVLAKS